MHTLAMKVRVHDFKFSELIFFSLSLKTWKSTQEVHRNLLYFLISNIHFQAIACVNHPQPRKKISFLISTGKAEEVSCTIISNSVKSPVGHRQYKKKKTKIRHQQFWDRAMHLVNLHGNR